MGPIVLLVSNWMGPNVQSGKTRWDQTSSLANIAWDQMSMGPLIWLPSLQRYHTIDTFFGNINDVIRQLTKYAYIFI